MKIYICASNTEYTVICRAKNKQHALEIALEEYWNDHGFMPDCVNNSFEVYEANKYLDHESLVINEHPYC